MTEEIIADLSKIHGLRVISRTSVMRFKGTKTDLKTIGRQLNVRYLLEGGVRRAQKLFRSFTFSYNPAAISSTDETLRRAAEQFLAWHPDPTATTSIWKPPVSAKVGWRGLTHQQVHEAALDDMDPRLREDRRS